LPFEATVERVKAALATEGFGVLTTIDMQATLKAKIGVELEKYVILGACNPQLAHRALNVEREIGLLLPCNVVVRDAGHGRTIVSAMDPSAALGIVENAQITSVADDARARLVRVVELLEREAEVTA
jgi:uncharacterized protein (DUF302 family)